MTKENLKQLCHLMGGLIIIVLAFQFFEQEQLNLSILYIVVGCIFVIVAGISTWLEKILGKFTAIFFFLEAFAFYYASKNAHEADDSIVNSTLKLATLAYVVLALIFLFSRDSKSKKRRSKRRSRSRSSSRSISPDSGLN